MARKSLTPGTHAGPYTIRSEISQDASGISYTASLDDRSVSLREFFPEGLSQRRKLKIFAPRRALKAALENAVSSQRERFELYLALKSPGLSGGLALLNENGTVYLATERPAGESLGRLAAQDGTFAPGFVRSILDELSNGMRGLADVGLVHGAISPETILLRANGRPVLVHPALPDAGISALAVNELDGVPPGYVPPEFLLKDAGVPGPWSDVYALAASFFTLITGRMPASAIARSEALASGEDDPLDLELLEEKLFDDPALFNALERALEPDVKTRIPSMIAFEEAMLLAPSEAHVPAAVPANRSEAPEGASGFVPSRQGWWAEHGRSFVAAGTVICLLVLSVPLMLSIGDKSPGGVVEASEAVTQSVTAGAPGDVPETAENTEGETETPVEPEPETENAVIPASVTEWQETDQMSPDAVSAFYETYADDADINGEVRERWIALDNERWQAAKDENTLSAYETYTGRFDTGLRLNGAYLSEARELIDAFLAEKEREAQEKAERAAAEVASGPVPGDVITDCEDCPELVVLTAASGDSPELAVMRREVTLGEFRSFIAATGRQASSGCIVGQKGAASPWTYGSFNSFEDPGYPASDSHPVTCVSFDDADAFAGWLSKKTGESYRLPTAEEWELAARQTSKKPTIATACGLSNFADTSLTGKLQNMQIASCSDDQPFAAPSTGPDTAVLDMYGNAAEWVSDCVDAECGTHLALGGSWASGPGIIGAGLRETYSAGSRNSALGFRLVRTF